MKPRIHPYLLQLLLALREIWFEAMPDLSFRRRQFLRRIRVYKQKGRIE